MLAWTETPPRWKKCAVSRHIVDEAAGYSTLSLDASLMHEVAAQPMRRPFWAFWLTG